MTRVTGKIRIHPRGFGFVAVEGEEDDIFVPGPATHGAVDKDIVEVEVLDWEDKRGPSGEVIEVVERGRTHLAGTIIKGGAKPYALCPAVGVDEWVAVGGDETLKEGDRVILKVEKWGEERSKTLARISKMIGHISDPSIDIEYACEEAELRTVFPKQVLAAAKKLGTEVSDIQGRDDLRKIETITIDPATAKDFDDALSLREDKQGHFYLTVHIADVSHYVTRGSLLDKEAVLRCNSTYFPGRCIPMLPPTLADNLCSLKPEVDRLTVSVDMHFDRVGELLDYEIKRSVIRSDKRFSYEEALEVLQGRKKSPYAPLLKRMKKLCGLLKDQRRERGSIEFALPEVVIEVDDKGVPTGTRLVEYDITHQMVEEFMLKANEVVATYLTEEGKSMTYRVHDMPTDDDLDGFYQLAGALGFRLRKDPTLEDLQLLFDAAHKTPHGARLAISFIRSMKLAIYSPDNIGHYGLALEHYCHFTSPIRRYADLVIHRLLFDDDYTDKEIDAISKACSEQERTSSRAEMGVLELKKLRLLAAERKKNPRKQWEAIVTTVKRAGVTFELNDLCLEGFVHISAIGKEYYTFNEQKMRMEGGDTGEVLTPGTPITVMLRDLNLITRDTRWERVV